MRSNLVWYLLAAAGLALTVAAGTQFATPAHAHFDAGSSLLVSTRSELRVCLTGPAATGQAAQRLQHALGAAGTHRHWAETYGTVPKPDLGCPVSLPSTRISRGVVVGPGVTAEPSPYRTVVVVLDDAAARHHLGDQPAALVPYELMRVDDHVVVTVTQAVVVSAAFVGTPEFATEYLTPALGLDPALR